MLLSNTIKPGHAYLNGIVRSSRGALRKIKGALFIVLILCIVYAKLLTMHVSPPPTAIASIYTTLPQDIKSHPTKASQCVA